MTSYRKRSQQFLQKSQVLGIILFLLEISPFSIEIQTDAPTISKAVQAESSTKEYVTWCHLDLIIIVARL